jgi:hypothetical protein
LVGAKVLDIFSKAAGTTSSYNAGDSPPIKAGQREARPHLMSTCTESNTFIREK